jgi:hypothetical protein
MFIFVGKNKQNRKFFKEKLQADSHSIRQDFDAEKQDLAIFDTKV